MEELAELKHELELLKTKSVLAGEKKERYDLSTMIGSEVPKWAVRLKDLELRSWILVSLTHGCGRRRVFTDR